MMKLRNSIMIAIILSAGFCLCQEHRLLVSTEHNCLMVHGEPENLYKLKLFDEIANRNVIHNELNEKYFISSLRNTKIDDLFAFRRLNPLVTDSVKKQVTLLNQHWYRKILTPTIKIWEGLTCIDATIEGLLSPPPKDLRSFIGINKRYRFIAQGVITLNMIPYSRLELAKSYLLHGNGNFFTVFGDCMVAEHLIFEDFPYVPVVEYGYNTLYLYTLEEVPVLYSAGIDSQGIIWLISEDGWLAFFDTRQRSYLEGPINQKPIPGALVARDNRSSSYFVPLEDQNGYGEIVIEFTEEKAISHTVKPILQSDVTLVLYSDDKKIVYVTESENKFSVKQLVRATNMIEDLLIGDMTADERVYEGVYEGVYLPDTNSIFLLIGVPPVDGLAPFQGDPDWKSIRLVKQVNEIE